jgi:hypothetical protein
MRRYRRKAYRVGEPRAGWQLGPDPVVFAGRSKEVTRIAFLDGALEIMSPSKDHERIKSYIGRLIEAYALERDIHLSP